MARYPNEMPDQNDEGSTEYYDVPSAVEIPKIEPMDPQGGFQDTGEVDFLGVGTGGETLHSDGSVTTRAKVDGSGGGNGPAGVDGGSA